MLATTHVVDTEIDTIRSSQAAPDHAARDSLTDRLVHGASRIFDAKDHLFREGDQAAHVYKIDAGHVCVYRMMQDGRRQIISFAYPGDVIGLGATQEHAACAQAMTRTRVRCVPGAALEQAARSDAKLGMKLYEAASRELHSARELLFTVSQRTAPERVAAFLLALSQRNARCGEDPCEFVLPMTRIDIADFLGLTIETVSRTFTKLRIAGLIDLAQRVLVTIMDAGALADVAQGQPIARSHRSAARPRIVACHP